MVTIICCGSALSDQNIIADYLINLGKYKVKVLNRKTRCFGGFKEFSLSHEFVSSQLKKVDFNDYDFVVVENVYRTADIEAIKNVDSLAWVIFFNDPVRVLIDHANGIMDAREVRRYVENEYYGYRASSDGCDLIHIIDQANCYINAAASDKETLLASFFEWLNGKKILSEIEQAMSQASILLDSENNKTACVIINKTGEIIGKGINKNLVDEPVNKSIKTKIIDFNSDIDSEYFFEKQINRVFDASFNIHAEVGALWEAGKVPAGSVALVTKKPCINCLKLLYFSGIKEIYYLYDYFDTYTDIVIASVSDLSVNPFSGILNRGR